jgi:preprotein translocase subunit YajC
VQLLPIIVILFAVLWLFVLRPQRRRQREQQQLLDHMEPGAEVLTAGGLYGTLRTVDDDEALVEISPGIEVRVSRRAIVSVVTPEDAELAELERAQAQAESEARGEADAVGAGEPGQR